MRKDIADQWADNLRSGIYKQGKNALCKDGKFCCLGVLCEIARSEGVVAIMDSDDGRAYGNTHRTQQVAVLPEPVMDWAGLRTCTGHLSEGDSGPSLAKMNDEEGMSFEEIAKVINERYQDL